METSNDGDTRFLCGFVTASMKKTVESILSCEYKIVMTIIAVGKLNLCLFFLNCRVNARKRGNVNESWSMV